MAEKNKKNLFSSFFENKTSLQLVIYLGILVLIFLISYFLIYPSVLDIREQRKEVLIKDKVLEQKKSTIDDFKKTAEKYRSLSLEVEKIDKVISPEADLPKLLFQFENLAINNGIILMSISFGDVYIEKNVGAIPVNLQLLGSYQSFKKYLEALAVNIPLFDVQVMDFSGETEEGGDSYSFSLKVNTYTEDTSMAKNLGGVKIEETEEKETEEEKK